MPPSLSEQHTSTFAHKGSIPVFSPESRREEILNEFADRYERLMSVLCDAAKNGCAPRLESEYGNIRRWLLDIRASEPSHFSGVISMSRGNTSTGPADDPIVQIVSPATLADLLAADSGELIERVSRVSEVVFEYRASSRGSGSPIGD